MSFLNPSEHLNLKYWKIVPQDVVHRPNPHGTFVEPDSASAVAVPYWVEQAFNRNKLDIVDVLDYSKVRSVLSVSDIARLIACNNFEIQAANLLKPTYCFAGYLPWHWRNSCSEADRKELSTLIEPLAYAETTKAEIVELLTMSDWRPDAQTAESVYHRVRLSKDNTFFVLIDRGFLNALQDREYAIRYFSDHLKALYSVLPISQVSYYGVFRDYLQLL